MSRAKCRPVTTGAGKPPGRGAGEPARRGQRDASPLAAEHLQGRERDERQGRDGEHEAAEDEDGAVDREARVGLGATGQPDRQHRREEHAGPGPGADTEDHGQGSRGGQPGEQPSALDPDRPEHVVVAGGVLRRPTGREADRDGAGDEGGERHQVERTGHRCQRRVDLGPHPTSGERVVDVVVAELADRGAHGVR